MTLDLSGRTAVITGAGSGIGRALAHAAAARGMALALCDLDEPRLRAAAAELTSAGRSVLSRRLDVVDGAALEAFAAEAAVTLPPIGAVFANAGVLRAGTWWKQPLADVRLTLDVNLLGVINTAQAFVGRMVEAGVPARMVFTGSVASLVAAPGLGAYTASKHAVWALAETLRYELQREGSPVGVSVICPGAVRTGLVDVPSEAPGGAMQARLKARMAEAGLEPSAVAEAALQGVEAGRFWIFPQPAFKAAARQRFDRVLAEEDPVRPS